ncbi:MAG: hypothetical protein ACI9JD_002581 [Rhodococcus sp. (in: high G+C Gram-positive bacteria)]|jgi:hypothetical protein
MQLFALSSLFKDCAPPKGGQDPTVSVSKAGRALAIRAKFADPHAAFGESPPVRQWSKRTPEGTGTN